MQLSNICKHSNGKLVFVDIGDNVIDNYYGETPGRAIRASHFDFGYLRKELWDVDLI